MLGLNSICVGASLAVYGGYQYFKGPEDNKKLAMCTVAAGIAGIGYGIVELSNSTAAKPKPLSLANETNICSLQQNTDCPIDRLKFVLSTMNKTESYLPSIFEIFERTRGLFCEDYLNLTDSQYPLDITVDDMQQSAMWGLKRGLLAKPFLALKYFYNESTSVVRLFEVQQGLAGYYFLTRSANDTVAFRI